MARRPGEERNLFLPRVAVNMHGLRNLHTNPEMYGSIVLGLKLDAPLI